MTNPFSTEALVPNWTTASEILKGDVEGHPFHGNQYTHHLEVAQYVANNPGEYEYDSQRLLDAANFSANHAEDAKLSSSHLRAIAALHQALADAHHATSEQVYDDGEGGDIYHHNDQHEAAGKAHQKVADYANTVADNLDSGRGASILALPALRGLVDEAKSASKEAEISMRPKRYEP